MTSEVIGVKGLQLCVVISSTEKEKELEKMDGVSWRTRLSTRLTDMALEKLMLSVIHKAEQIYRFRRLACTF